MALSAVALVGATGTGKSALAMSLAAEQQTCLVSCDSMQVYRGLDIGTAKPSKQEQAAVRHALIDCADVQEVWSAQTWANAARDVIKQENDHGRMPIIAGGTGMYLKALLEGFAAVPDEKAGVRESFEVLQQSYGTPYLHEKLKAIDPVLADRLENQDTQRIIRGLSVFESTGVPLSVWQQQQAHQQQENPIVCPVFVLETPRPVLRERLSQRFMQMLDMGWLDETKWLQAQGLADTHPVMRAVGYRQLLQYVRGELDLDAATTAGITATRGYAKRQSTWFRNQTPNAKRGDADSLTPFLKQAIKGLKL